MILCVTLNPCLDKTLTVPAWQPGMNVRGEEVRAVVGGKGNNVARALKGLGRDPRPLTFLGGAVGEECQRLLRRDDGLDPLVVRTAAPTRVILTVRTRGTDDQTGFFDPNPAITPAEARAMLAEFRRQVDRPEIQAVTLSGSAPAAAADSLYAEMVRGARARQVPVVLDTYGLALALALEARPDVLKLNTIEAAQLAGAPAAQPGAGAGPANLAMVRRWALEWAARACTWAIVTAGPGPIIAARVGQAWMVTPPAVRAVNPIGSGDCMVAGLVDGLLRGLDAADLLRWATAAAVANAVTWDAGAITRPAVEQWVRHIQVADG